MPIHEYFLGSKKNNSVPYTYHAQERVIEGEDIFTKDWFCDTLCGLCNHLLKLSKDPLDIRIFECFNNGPDIEMPKHFYMDESGKWLQKKELCNAHLRYGSFGAGSEGNCEFINRNMFKIIS